MRKRIDDLENKVKTLELKCRNYARQFEMFSLQINHDVDIIQGQERRICKLEAMFKDDSERIRLLEALHHDDGK